MSQLKTDWIRIATEGETFQNVVMQKQWLEDIAETYDPKEYGARIWPDHRRWYGAWGDVLEVKTEVQDGKLRLFAKLRPNSQLIQANESDQKVYTSIELDPNFTQSGKAYLTGLAVTDEPASLGTEKLKFSTKDRYQNHKYGKPEQMVMEFSAVNDESDDDETGLIKAFSSFIKGFTQQQPAATTPIEDESMDKEQFEALMGKIDTFSTKLTDLETKVEKFGKPEENEEETGDDTGEDENTGDAVTSEQFSKLQETITGFTTKLESMESKFSKLEQEVDGQEPDPSGEGNSFSVV